MLFIALVCVFLLALRISGFMFQIGKGKGTLSEHLIGGVLFASCATFLFYYFT